MTRSDLDARQAVSAFLLPGPLADLVPLGGGHINHSFIATVSAAGGPIRYVLQRINREVFARPDLVMENVARVLNHLSRFAADRVPALIAARQGGKWHLDQTGECWRLMTYLEGTVSR
ncbi:MAG: phosphotransferase, partial [Gemmatimonadota bacterium]